MASDPWEDEKRRRDSPPPVEFVRPAETQGPPPPRDQPPAAWVPRPEDYQVPPSWAGPAPRPVGPSNLPKIAAVLLLLSGVLGMAGAVPKGGGPPALLEYCHLMTKPSPGPALLRNSRPLSAPS